MILLESIPQLNNREDVLNSLQDALKLEHATIPPYLYALFSIKGSADDAYDRIHQVAVEEMMHMTMVCNIINALGGKPSIADPNFLLNYPSTLPMSIGGDQPNALLVPLKRYSRALVETIFMKIEEPEHPIEFPEATFSLAGETPGDSVQYHTIGEFYAAVSKAIESLGDSAFLSEPTRQFDVPKLFAGINSDLIPSSVVDVSSAQKTIAAIVEQGEGTETSPEDPVTKSTNDYSHYYRFQEISRGQPLIRTAEDNYEWGQDPLQVQEENVYAIAGEALMANVPAADAAGEQMRNLT